MGQLTREGRVFVLTTVGVGIAAVNTGNNLLFLMLGLFISLLLISMVLSEVVLFGLRVERHLPSRCTAQIPVVIAVTVQNRKRWFPSYALELVDDDRARQSPKARVQLLKVSPGTSETCRYFARFWHRGRWTLRFVRVVTRYPFGLVEKTHEHAIVNELLVFPGERPTPYEVRRLRDRGDGAPSRSAGVGTEVAGLRDYHTGDEARTIHALRSAAMGRWLVVEREQDADRRIMISLTTAAPRHPSPHFVDAFETMVQHAAYVAHDAWGRGAAVMVRSAAEESPWVAPSANLDPILRFLAELTPSTAETSPSCTQGTGIVRLAPVEVSASAIQSHPLSPS